MRIFRLSLMFCSLILLTSFMASASTMQISIEMNDTTLRLHDDDNDFVFNAGNLTTSISWRYDSQKCQESYNYTDTLDNLSAQVAASCNLSMLELKDVVNQRLDVKLSEFGESLNTKLDPIIDYGDKFKVCQEEKTALMGQINSNELNETKLRNEISLLKIDRDDAREDLEWTSYGLVAFVVLAVFSGLYITGGINKIKERFGSGA